MEQKRYQIFISSTFADLEKERFAVLNQLLTFNCVPVGMELFPAADDEQFEFIKKLIDESDYYILIIKGRYGSIAEDGLSYTEKEYDYAVATGIPVLAFLHNHPEDIPAKHTDPQNADKLAAFKKKVSTGRVIKYWENPDDLKANVQTAVQHAFKNKPRTGWVRANSEQDLSTLLDLLSQETKKCERKQKEIDSLQKKWEKDQKTFISSSKQAVKKGEEKQKEIDSLQREISTLKETCAQLKAALDEANSQSWRVFIEKEAEALRGADMARRAARTEVFISYAQKDKDYLHELQAHLRMLKKTAEINLWDDTHIKPGEDFNDKTRDAIARAKVVVLMVSAFYFSSEWIWNEELPRIMDAADKDGATILWLPVSTCSYEDTVITKYQSVIDPRTPLSKRSTAERNEIYTELVKRIKELFDIHPE